MSHPSRSQEGGIHDGLSNRNCGTIAEDRHRLGVGKEITKEQIMACKRKIAVLCLAALTTVLLVTGHASARATKTEFTGEQISFVPFQPPAKMWFTGGNNPNSKLIMHIRGVVNYNIFEADDPRMCGEAYVTLNIDIEVLGFIMTPEGPVPVFGDGTFHVTTVFCPWDIEGTWECSGAGTFTDGVGSGRQVGHGTGELEGQVLKWYLIDDVESFGRILDPHGE